MINLLTWVADGFLIAFFIALLAIFIILGVKLWKDNNKKEAHK